MDAELEYKKKGEKSQLHIIIFDEIDALCKKRGASSSGAEDKVVNQLLSKIDGVDTLNNILIIGMTNRLDLIDPALLRPGRLELILEISLPNKDARKEIFMIHTKQMATNSFMAQNIDLEELASKTKNYTGAEIAAVVRAACSFALERKVKTEGENTVVKDEDISIEKTDFMNAIQEITPGFGVDDNDYQIIDKVIYETSQFKSILEIGMEQIHKLKKTTLYKTSSLLIGGITGSGKTTLAVQMAFSSNFPFIKLIRPKDLVGLSESDKVNFIKSKFNDAYRSEEAVIVLDEIESLIEYVNIGPRFSNNVLQALKIFIKEESKNKLFVIATTSLPDVMEEAGVMDCFTKNIMIQGTRHEDYETLCKQNNAFKDVDYEEGITIKKLLSLLPE